MKTSVHVDHADTNEPAQYVLSSVTHAMELKQCKCPTLSEWVNGTWYIYTVECYLTIKIMNWWHSHNMDKP